MSLVSILVSCKNEIGNIDEFWHTVCSQTYQNFELIFVDDGSVDGSFERLIEISNGDARLKAFKFHSSMGLASRLNFAFSRSSGFYIARFDVDDRMVSTRLQKQVDFLDKNTSISIVGSNAYICDLSGKVVSTSNMPISNDDIYRYMRLRSPFFHPSVMFRRSFFADLGGYDIGLRRAQDFELWRRASRRNFLMANISEPLIFYTSSNGSNLSNLFASTAVGLKIAYSDKDFILAMFSVFNLFYVFLGKQISFLFNFIKNEQSKS